MDTRSLVISVIIAVLGSGGLATIITAWASKRKNKAEATATNVKSILEIDARLNDRISRLEERVAALEKENLELKAKELQLKHDNDVYLEEINDLKEENEFLKEENSQLKSTNMSLLERLKYIGSDNDENLY